MSRSSAREVTSLAWISQSPHGTRSQHSCLQTAATRREARHIRHCSRKPRQTEFGAVCEDEHVPDTHHLVLQLLTQVHLQSVLPPHHLQSQHEPCHQVKQHIPAVLVPGSAREHGAANGQGGPGLEN